MPTPSGHRLPTCSHAHHSSTQTLDFLFKNRIKNELSWSSIRQTRWRHYKHCPLAKKIKAYPRLSWNMKKINTHSSFSSLTHSHISSTFHSLTHSHLIHRSLTHSLPHSRLVPHSQSLIVTIPQNHPRIKLHIFSSLPHRHSNYLISPKLSSLPLSLNFVLHSFFLSIFSLSYFSLLFVMYWFYFPTRSLVHLNLSPFPSHSLTQGLSLTRHS